MEDNDIYIGDPGYENDEIVIAKVKNFKKELNELFEKYQIDPFVYYYHMKHNDKLIYIDIY